MQRDTETTMLGQPVAFSDGLGDRVVLEDEATRDTSEKLYLRPLFKPQQRAVQERAARLINFTHIRFARVRGVDTEGDQLVLASDYVAGPRLSTVLEIAADHQLRIDIDTALHLTRELLSALAVLHDSRNVTHGVLSPERLVLTPKWRLVVVDYTLGLAIERLKLSRSRLWNDLRVPMPPAAGVVRFDRRADVAQVGMVALALVLGRPIRRDEYPNRIRQLLDEVVEWRRATRTTPLGAELRGWFERALPLESRRPFTSIREAQKGLEDVVTQSAEYRPALGSLKEFLKRYDELMVRLAPPVETAPDAGAAEEPEVAVAEDAAAELAEERSPAPMSLAEATPEEADRAEAPVSAPDGETVAADAGASATASRSERPKAKGGAKSSLGREKARKPRKSAARPAKPQVDPPPSDDTDDEIAWIEAELARLASEGALQVAGTDTERGDESASAGRLPGPEADAPVVEPPAGLDSTEQPTASADAETTADLTSPADASLDEILEITPLADAADTIDIAPAPVGDAGADTIEALFAAEPTTSEPAAQAGEIDLDREPVALEAHEESPAAGESLVQLSPGPEALGEDADRSLDVWELDVAAIEPVADASVQPDLPAPTTPDNEAVAHADDVGEVPQASMFEPDDSVPGPLSIHEASGSATSGGASTPARDDTADDLSAGEVVREVETLAATPALVETAVPLDAAAEQHTASIGAAPEWTLTNPTPDARPAAEAVDEATGPAVEADVLQSPLRDELTAPLPFDQEPLEAAAILSAHAETVEEILGALAEPEDTLASHDSTPDLAIELTTGSHEPPAELDSVIDRSGEPRADEVETTERASRDTESPGDEAGSAVSGWLDNISWLRGRRNETPVEAARDEEHGAPAEADVAPPLETETALREEHDSSPSVAAPTILFGESESAEADTAVALNSDPEATPPGSDATGDDAAPARTSLWDRVRAIGRRGGRRAEADDEIVFPRASGSVSIRPETVADDTPPPAEPEVEQTDAALTAIVETEAIPVPASAEPATTGADGPSAADEAMAPAASAGAGDSTADFSSSVEVDGAVETATVSSATAQAATTESDASLQAPPAAPDAADTDSASEALPEAPPEPVSSAPVDDGKTILPAPSPLGYVDALAVAPPPIPVSVDAPPSAVTPEPDRQSAPEGTATIDSGAPAGSAEPDAVAAIEPLPAPAEASPAAAADSRDTRASEQSGPRKGRRKGKSGKPRRGKGKPAEPIPSPIAVAPRPPAMVDEPVRSVAPAPAGPAAPEISPAPLAASEARLPPWLRGRSTPDTPPAADAAGEPAVPLSAVSAPAPFDPGTSLPPPMPQSVAPSVEPGREWTAHAGDGPPAEADVATAPLGLRDDHDVVWHQGVGSPAEVSQTERRALGTSRWRSLDWRRIAAASIVLILLEGASFAAVYWMMTPTQLGTLAVQTNPSGIEVLVDGRPHGLTPILEELPPGRYVLELRGLKARKVVPVEISAGVHTAQFIAWPREVLTGGVRIVSVPDGAEVTIDGTAYGPAPVEVPDLTAGRHQVVISGSGGSVSTTVHVLADRVTEFEVAIYSGWVAVFSPVKLDLFEQGRPIGTSEDGRILAAPGLHEIEAVSERLGYRAVFRVNVVPGEITPLSIELPPGRLIVDGAEGSEVWVDGRLAGVAPLAEIDVPLGTRRIELRHPDGRVDRFTETATLVESIRITPRQLVGRNGARPPS